MTDRHPLMRRLVTVLAVLLSVFVLAEVNYPFLTPQTQLAVFALLGLTLIFLRFPIHPRIESSRLADAIDAVLIIGVVLCFGYVAIQSEPLFESYWIEGQPLGNRAGIEQSIDYLAGLAGIILVLEATRRAIGWTLPLLALIFLAYAVFGPTLPNWLFPHRGYDWQRIVSQTFLHSQGVFGIALRVMFTYVFLFVLFGAILEKTGATGYILAAAKRLFRNSAGGPAKVAVISSGAMGSLSGSAVANTATTGTFTIPMMRSAGFKPSIAAGIEAAASSGGALMPPIMGAGAYMMLEIVEPAVTYWQIIKSALIPAIIYYLALLLSVHFHSRKIGVVTSSVAESGEADQRPPQTQGVVFAIAFLSLIVFLGGGYTPFRAVSLSLLLVVIASLFSAHTRLGLKGLVDAARRAADGGISLVAAAACVGIVIGVVTLTGVGSKLPSTLLPLAQNNLLLALLLLMTATIILGMGLPSAVCYLLVATLIGPVLDDLGIVPLAAHLFIFYFGMMSMVTPPVALAAYTASAIAGAGIMQSGVTAFRFALVGFALPFAFVIKPELLFLSPGGAAASVVSVVENLLATLIGVIPLAAGIAGYAFAPLARWQRFVLILAALTFFLIRTDSELGLVLILSLGVVAIVGLRNWREGFAK